MKKTTRDPGPSTLSKGLRRYLYLTAAITGAAIMIVEILGAKMLSPYVGLSHFVWTAQIAVTLVALAGGYYVGGRMADRSQNPGRLYRAILGAAVYLVLAVLICQPVAFWCLDFNLAVGTLLASTILFFIPLALLAMTGPFLVRVITSSVAGVGGNVGRLTSIGTLGSFAGTICIGYFMLPLLPNSTSMYLTAGVLTLICVGYFAVFNRQYKAPLAGATMLAIGIGLLATHPPKSRYKLVVERFHGNSHFGEIQVLENPEGDLRLYSNDYLTQNTYDPSRKQSVSAFTFMLAGLARAYATNINDVLCIGMGVGIVPMEFAHRGAKVDVVEINPAVVPVAVKYFDFEPDRVHLTIDDGRHFLNRCEKQYDAVVLDAFLGDSSPSHLLTREAFTAMRRVLRPGGVLVINVFCQLDEGRDFFAASLNKTLKSVFAGVRMHYDGNQSYFVATDHSDPSFAHRPDLDVVHPSARPRAETAFITTVDTTPEHGMVLVDDYNPLEFYDAKNRESLRRRLASNDREIQGK